MARHVPVKCWNCGNEWQEDLDRHQAESTAYRSGQGSQPARTRVESYHVDCPRCGKRVIVDVEIEE